MTVFVYVDTSKQVGDKDHIKVFASADAAETWFEQNDPEGVAFEYEVLNEPVIRHVQRDNKPSGNASGQHCLGIDQIDC
jgi:hypothetical protein